MQPPSTFRKCRVGEPAHLSGYENTVIDDIGFADITRMDAPEQWRVDGTGLSGKHGAGGGMA